MTSQKDDFPPDPQPIHLRNDRDRGVLTRTDREVMAGTKEYVSDQGLRNAQYRIREHIRNSLFDILLIAEKYEQEEIGKILKRQRKIDREGNHLRTAFDRGLFALAARIVYTESDQGVYQSFQKYLQESVARGITVGLNQSTEQGTNVEVDVDVSVSFNNDAEEMIETLINANLSLPDVHLYLGRLDANHVIDVLRERDEVINVGENTIGPDHDIFDFYT